MSGADDSGPEKKSLTTEEKLALAIEALSELVVLFDAQDRIVIANKAWRDLNADVSEFTKPGTLFEDFLNAIAYNGLATEAAGCEKAWIRERLERHRNPDGPFEVAYQNGQWIRVYEQKLPDGGTILIVSDITESKRIDRALSESQQRFQALVNNSPAKIHIKDAQGRYVLINTLAATLFGVTDEEARGKTSHDIFPRDKADAFAAHDQGVHLALELAEEAPTLYADLRKQKQILVNLMSNAIKFTDAGGKVAMKIWSQGSSGYVFQVSDTGIGIALEDIPKALSQFGQVDSTLGRKHEGTGLGLPLTKALVELHGGSLDLQSQPGVGTRV